MIDSRNQASNQMSSFMGMTPKTTPKKISARQWLALGAGATALILMLLGGGVLMQRSGWSPGVFLASIFPSNNQQGQVFSGGAGLSQQEARKQYLEAYLLLKKDKDFAKALKLFQQLEGAYPGLQDWLFLHQAECLIGLGSEGPAQERLQLVLAKMPKSPIRSLVLYQLGQSYFRGRQPQLAQETFQKLASQEPESDFGIASQYYLGWIAAEKEVKLGSALNIKAAEPFWMNYLKQSPTGRFAPELAKELDQAIAQKTPEQAALIGKGYAVEGEDWAKVKQLLVSAPLAEGWFELGTAQLKTGELAKGVSSLVKGIPLEKERQRAKDGIDMLARNSAAPVKDLTAVYDSVGDKKSLVAGDYVLWKLSQLDTARSSAYYQVLLTHYADKDYAPESSWNLMWPLLKANQHQAFQEKAAVHLSRYPYSKSAAKIRYWQGKLKEREHKAIEAIALYREILKKSPTSYYAFRAYGRLMALEKHQSDPGWQTDTAGRNYPPSSDSQHFSVVPAETSAFFKAHPVQDTHAQALMLNQAKELQEAKASEDIALLFQSSTGEVPASVKSWQEALNEDPAQSIRTIRDALDDEAKLGHLPTSDALKLLYPHYYSKYLQQESARNNIDPVLAQSLMREESYFNPMAVSGSDARGLMQLLPTTAQEVAKQMGLSGYTTLSLFSPEINTKLGSRYLGYLHKTFQGQSMPSVGAYNGGPNAMKRWIESFGGPQADPDWFVESIPYEQTRDYIKKVFGSYWNYQRVYHPDHPFHAFDS
jgi:soluble lytic murein transglycosylase